MQTEAQTESTYDAPLAPVILGVSLLIGVVGDRLFFDDFTFGINVPLFVLVFLTAAWGLLTYFKRPIVPHHAFFALVAFFFGALLSVFHAPQLALFNLLLLVVSMFFFVRYVSTAPFLGGSFWQPVLDSAQALIVGWLDGPLLVLIQSGDWLRRLNLAGEQQTKVRAVLRGLLLTLPILLVFGVLLGSADQVFGDLLSDSLGWLIPDNLFNLYAHLLVVGVFAWGSLAALKLMLMGGLLTTLAPANPELPPIPERPFSLGMIEATMVMVSVDVMFLIFVIIQGRYLFGGESNITAQGYTYSEYARRGFFEILAVSVLTMLLVLILDLITHRQEGKATLFRVLCGGMIGLTLVLLVAAFLRLNLYEEAYGFTRLRIMTQVFIVWLALLFLVLLRDILSQKGRYFWWAGLAVGFAFVLSLNALNMDAFIAARNIDQFANADDLDIVYLLTLSDDAVPTVAKLLDDPTWREDEMLLGGLGRRLFLLDNYQESRGALSYHFSRDRAWKALDARRDVLGAYTDPSKHFYYDSWRY